MNFWEYFIYYFKIFMKIVASIIGILLLLFAPFAIVYWTGIKYFWVLYFIIGPAFLAIIWAFVKVSFFDIYV